MTRFDDPQAAGFPQGPRPGMDPDAYAQQYANTNGISLDEAKSQLKARFGDPQKPPISAFGPQAYPPLPPSGNIWGGTTTTAATNSASTVTVSTASTVSTVSSPKDYGKTDAQKKHMNEENYYKYIEMGQNTNLTKDEIKDQKKLTKAYCKEIEQFQKDYEKDCKAKLKEAKKAGKSKAELTILKNEYESKAEGYVLAKFKEKYPDVDYYAVQYNASEIGRAVIESSFFHAVKPKLIQLS